MDRELVGENIAVCEKLGDRSEEFGGCPIVLGDGNSGLIAAEAIGDTEILRDTEEVGLIAVGDDVIVPFDWLAAVETVGGTSADGVTSSEEFGCELAVASDVLFGLGCGSSDAVGVFGVGEDT